jgi:predicted TIM-barrel fold metal-dependent hydrolase
MANTNLTRVSGISSHSQPKVARRTDGVSPDRTSRIGLDTEGSLASVVDADAHVNEDVAAWTALAERHPGWLSAGQSGGKWVAQIEGKLYPRQDGPGCGVPIDASTNPQCAVGAADVEARLADMSAEGIDIQVLFGGLVIGVTGYDDVGLAADVCATYNEWLLVDVCGRAPERLKGVAAVPLQHVEHAISEVERAKRLGAVAVTIPPVLGARNLDDAALQPFFEAAAALDLAVAVHSAPGMNLPLPGADRFENYAMVHALSFPVDQMVALTALALGGVLDRFPRLRVAFLEAGVGWVPYFVHRLHEHHEKLPHLLAARPSDPRDLVARGQCWFSFEADEPLLDTYIEHLGDESLVYASDYPHWDSDFPGTVDAVRRQAKSHGLSDETVARILGDNASRLYGL